MRERYRGAPLFAGRKPRDLPTFGRMTGDEMTQALPLPVSADPRPRRPIRIVTAASLFDGHDAAINVMRRIVQASGAEVIHLGHNRSAAEIVECAIQEDA